MRRSLRSAGLAAALLLAAAPAVVGQVRGSSDAIEEVRSLSVRVDILGGGPEDGRLSGILEAEIRQELQRADILAELGEPRSGDCCVLRLDVRLARGAGRARFGVAYTARLELAYPDRFGTLPSWTLLWTGRMLGNIVERQDLVETLRFAAHDLAADFVDRYRERFPIR
ncbi:MAG: hypothetical protein AB7R55_17285 [Gemmatimonadales bacterium]